MEKKPVQDEPKNAADSNGASADLESGTEGLSADAQPDDTAAAPESLETQLDEWKKRSAYLMAELDNMRKRFLKERSDLLRMGNESLIKSLLPVLDNLELAIKAAKGANAAENEGAAEGAKLLKSLFQGVEMTFKHFEQSLEHVGVKPIDSLGKEFDPTVHEAVSQLSDKDRKDNVVIEVLQRGFYLHERVLRPSRVVVNKLAQEKEIN